MKHVSLALAYLLTCLASEQVLAATSGAPLESALKTDLTQYLATRSKPEHISALSLSVSFSADAPAVNVTAGKTQYDGRGTPVTPDNLYQIGSNTKAVTAAAVLQLEAEGMLTIDQTVGKWLPQYPAWRKVTIRQLLNMTAGIPTYDDMPAMLKAYAANPKKTWTPKELIAFSYPKRQPKAGWLYSNTAYIMSQLIIERASGNGYASEIRRRFLEDPTLGLKATYYEPSFFPASVTDLMVSGYFYNDDSDVSELAPLFGKDVKLMSSSWTQGAGGIVSTAENVARWSRALYEGPLLAPKQRRELMSIVSQKTGKPIAQVTPADPHGFGLGVGQVFVPGMGRFWFYEGETLGYRMVYAYLPASHLVYAVGLNSQPTKKEDHVGKLMQAIYKTLHAAGRV